MAENDKSTTLTDDERAAIIATAGKSDEQLATEAKAAQDAKAIATAQAAVDAAEAAKKVAATKAAEGEENNENDEEHAGHKPKIGAEKTADEADDVAKKAAEAADALKAEYTDTGDKAIDSVIAILKDREIPRADSEAIFGDAVKTGDFSKIDMPALEKAVGKATATMIVSSLERSVTDDAANTAAHAKSIHEMAGGKERWDAAANFVTTTNHFPEAEATEINEMLAKGGMSAKAAVAQIVAAHKASPTYKEPGTMLDGDTKPAINAEPLSRVDYYNQLSAENKRVGGPRKHVTDALNAQRRITMKAANS